MLKQLRSAALGFALFLAGGASATMITGAQDTSAIGWISQMNTQLLAYVNFTLTGKVGELAMQNPLSWDQGLTSLAIVNPSGTVRFIQTSATP